MQEDGEAQAFASPDLLEPKEFPFGYAVTPSRSEFRSPLELGGNDHSDRKGKKRENSLWDAKHWFVESPKEENAVFDFGQNEHEYKADNNAGGTLSSEDSHRLSTSPQSAPRPEADQEKRKPAIQSKWSRLRSLLPHVASQATQQLPGPSVIAGNSINITDELLAGGLSTLMLRLWFERDENDHRRVPFLFHRLRIRISDSLHPLDGSKSVFRIECDYANGGSSSPPVFPLGAHPFS
jgi:phospholipase D1/2